MSWWSIGFMAASLAYQAGTGTGAFEGVTQVPDPGGGGFDEPMGSMGGDEERQRFDQEPALRTAEFNQGFNEASKYGAFRYQGQAGPWDPAEEQQSMTVAPEGGILGGMSGAPGTSATQMQTQVGGTMPAGRSRGRNPDAMLAGVEQLYAAHRTGAKVGGWWGSRASAAAPAAAGVPPTPPPATSGPHGVGKPRPPVGVPGTPPKAPPSTSPGGLPPGATPVSAPAWTSARFPVGPPVGAPPPLAPTRAPIMTPGGPRPAPISGAYPAGRGGEAVSYAPEDPDQSRVDMTFVAPPSTYTPVPTPRPPPRTSSGSPTMGLGFASWWGGGGGGAG